METFTPQMVRQLRTDIRFSQSEFGKVLGVSSALIASIETGGRPITWNTQKKLNTLRSHLIEVIGDDWSTYLRCTAQLDFILENGTPSSR